VQLHQVEVQDAQQTPLFRSPHAAGGTHVIGWRRHPCFLSILAVGALQWYLTALQLPAHAVPQARSRRFETLQQEHVIAVREKTQHVFRGYPHGCLDEQMNEWKKG
jgi:hypothetical protein